MDAEKFDVVEAGVLTASAEQWEQARARFAVLNELMNRSAIGTSAVEDAAQQLSVSPRRVYALLSILRNGEGAVTDLLVSAPAGGRGRSRVPDEVEDVITEHINREFLARQKLSVAALHRRIAQACHRAGLPIPARNTVNARIAAMHPGRVARSRGGPDAARSRQSAGDVPPPVTAVLQQVQIDHTVVDLMIVDEYDRAPIGRPYLTIAIDVLSRCIPGFVVTLDPPSAVSVGLCLGRVCSDKSVWIDSLGLGADVRWPMAGKPHRLYIDNASEFKSEALQRGCEQHGIDLGYRPPGRPHYGGIVERIIGTVMTQVHELPGTTFSNPTQRGSYDSDSKAALTLRELERWLVLAVAAYHAEVHTGLRQSPAARWTSSTDADSALASSTVVDETAFLVDFLPVIRRRLTRTGFVIDHIQYFANALKPWIARRETLGQFVIRRDPRDLSRVWVLDPDSGGGYIEVPYRTMSHPAVTLWEHRAAVTRLREHGRAHIDEHALFSMIDKMREIATSAQKDTRRARRNRSRRAHLSSVVTSPNAMGPPELGPGTDDVSVPIFDDIEEW
ncbi:MAG: transposase [Mycobacterium sp.]|uniref:Mu transposase C-terminal domain-containing protein n=1 Tax=Nocardiaceae TaxID=85025 RepID=UPI00050C0D3F|nr:MULTISPECIES: Mu transposase C-terminal domain-containing protein [Rhodococcus]MDI9933441.1 DDE-type integrase/transposase/recombinase [Rhodococcus sp. IEGM 1354]MDV8128806.1 DDE-type integrase/transposase/recombinase [Rhodococcus sp. IEGM 1304]CAH0318260.1 Transposon Tn7 transposition protein TnsB [Rhodococcus fascians]